MGKNKFLGYSVLALLLTACDAQALGPQTLHVEGKVLPSFFGEYFILESSNHQSYAIDSGKLSPVILNKLSSSERSVRPVKLDIPVNAVLFHWSNDESSERSAFTKRSVASVPEKQNELYEHKYARISLRGRSLLSFSDMYFLVEADHNFFRIQKDKLSNYAQELLSSAVPGQNVSVSVPEDSVDFQWKTEDPVAVQSDYRTSAKSFYKLDGKNLTIRGLVHYSYDERAGLIESRDRFFQVRIADLNYDVRAKLEKVGASVGITLPAKIIEYTWKVAADAPLELEKY
jgi:hypothetical protein